MKKTRFVGLAAAAVALFGAIGTSAILQLSLSDIVAQSDHAVVGEIVAHNVKKIVGAESTDYYTTLTIEGRIVGTQTPVTVDVVYGGGFVDKERGDGVYNSEAPTEAETAVGKHVVAFYKWMDGFAGAGSNSLYNMHGGIYRTEVGPSGTMVLGRGTGYAIDRNVTLSNLDTQVAALNAKKQNR